VPEISRLSQLSCLFLLFSFAITFNGSVNLLGANQKELGGDMTNQGHVYWSGGGASI
jgi:hypothetical protein